MNGRNLTLNMGIEKIIPIENIIKTTLCLIRNLIKFLILFLIKLITTNYMYLNFIFKYLHFNSGAVRMDVRQRIKGFYYITN